MQIDWYLWGVGLMLVGKRNRYYADYIGTEPPIVPI